MFIIKCARTRTAVMTMIVANASAFDVTYSLIGSTHISLREPRRSLDHAVCGVCTYYTLYCAIVLSHSTRAHRHHLCTLPRIRTRQSRHRRAHEARTN